MKKDGQSLCHSFTWKIQHKFVTHNFNICAVSVNNRDPVKIFHADKMAWTMSETSAVLLWKCCSPPHLGGALFNIS